MIRTYSQTHWFYYIGYIIKKDQFKVNSVNPLYLLVHRINGFIEKKEGSKYFNTASIDSNSKVLKNMKNFGSEEKIYEEHWGYELTETDLL